MKVLRQLFLEVSYGRTNEILEYGKAFGDYAVYLGANFNVDKGWRDQSESYLETFTVILDIEEKIQNYL